MIEIDKWSKLSVLGKEIQRIKASNIVLDSRMTVQQDFFYFKNNMSLGLAVLLAMF